MKITKTSSLNTFYKSLITEIYCMRWLRKSIALYSVYIRRIESLIIFAKLVIQIYRHDN